MGARAGFFSSSKKPLDAVESINRCTFHKHQLKMLMKQCGCHSARVIQVLANLVPTNYMVFDMFACILHKWIMCECNTANTVVARRTRKMIHDVRVILNTSAVGHRLDASAHARAIVLSTDRRQLGNVYVKKNIIVRRVLVSRTRNASRSGIFHSWIAKVNMTNGSSFRSA